ncbi:VOC family protein [soil metagenome]
MITLNPYLNFNGNTEAAFNFYKTVFGSEFTSFVRFKDTEHGANLSDEDKEKIMHISLPVGNGNTLMATDALESMGHKLVKGTNFSLSIHPESLDEATEYFNKISADGKIDMPFEKAFWGAYFGLATDQFGIQWMVNFEEKPQP